MQAFELSPSYSAAPQITIADVADVAARGFRAIMCNRPDGESPDQTDVALIRAEAEARGLAFAFVPVISGAITPEDVTAFRAALSQLPEPVFAYCRSGARCQVLWKLVQ